MSGRRCSAIWSGARLERLEQAWTSPDLTRQEIADRFGTSMATLCRIARLYRWPPRRRGARRIVVTGPALQRLEEACRSGMSRDLIAGRFGMSPSALRRVVRDQGLSPPRQRHRNPETGQWTA